MDYCKCSSITKFIVVTYFFNRSVYKMESEKRICELAKELTELLKSKFEKVSFKSDFTVDDNLLSSKQYMQQDLKKLKETIERFI
mgnify:CR=1 FL=1